jgi:uncharacterized membrane protein YtjA (UPF0391 family)
MLGLAMDFLIGALVAATFGFSGIIASSAGVARTLALALFVGFLFLLVPGLIQAVRRRGSRHRRHRPDIPLIRIRGNHT